MGKTYDRYKFKTIHHTFLKTRQSESSSEVPVLVVKYSTPGTRCTCTSPGRGCGRHSDLATGGRGIRHDLTASPYDSLQVSEVFEICKMKYHIS